MEFEKLKLETNEQIEIILNLKSTNLLLFVENEDNLKQLIEESKIYQDIILDKKITLKKKYFICRENINKFFYEDMLEEIIPSYIIIKNSKLIELGPIDI